MGAPAYHDLRLTDVPVVAGNITDLAAAFTDPRIGGFDASHCVVAPPGAGVAEVGDLLVQGAAEAEDLLLFYYSGHGLLGTRSHELYLSLAATRLDRVPFTALPFAAVRDACLESGAKSRVVILDSCFSGRAIGETLGAEDEILGQVEVEGTYTLTSAPANRTALILPGEQHTAFTERLLRLLYEGSPQAGEMLSLGDIYRHLYARLRAEGLPVPQQRGTETADLLGLVRNRFAAVKAGDEPAIPGMTRGALEDAEDAARTVSVVHSEGGFGRAGAAGLRPASLPAAQRAPLVACAPLEWGGFEVIVVTPAGSIRRRACQPRSGKTSALGQRLRGTTRLGRRASRDTAMKTGRWSPWEDVPSLAGKVSSIAAVSITGEPLAVAIADGIPHVTETAAGRQGWDAMALPEGFQLPARDICASWLGDHDFKVFVLDGDGDLWESAQFGTLRNKMELPATGKATSIATCLEDRQELAMAFVTGDGIFCHTWEPEISLHDGCQLAGEGLSITDIACARPNPRELAVFTLDRHGRIWYSKSESRRTSTSDWSPWQSVPGPAGHITGIAANNSYSLNVLIAVADDGAVWHARYESGEMWGLIDWSSWDPISDAPLQ